MDNCSQSDVRKSSLSFDSKRTNSEAMEPHKEQSKDVNVFDDSSSYCGRLMIDEGEENNNSEVDTKLDSLSVLSTGTDQSVMIVDDIQLPKHSSSTSQPNNRNHIESKSLVQTSSFSQGIPIQRFASFYH